VFLSTEILLGRTRTITTSLHGLVWQAISVHPPKRAGAIIGASDLQVDKLVEAGELEAVTLGGRKLIRTASLLAYLSRAEPWKAEAVPSNNDHAKAKRRGPRPGSGADLAEQALRTAGGKSRVA
jgi:hypothetical protein